LGAWFSYTRHILPQEQGRQAGKTLYRKQTQWHTYDGEVDDVFRNVVAEYVVWRGVRMDYEVIIGG